MATTKFELKKSDGYVQVAAEANTEFYIENVSTQTVRLVYNVGAPAADTAHHELGGGEGTIRLAPGDVYCMGEKNDVPAVLIVSK